MNRKLNKKFLLRQSARAISVVLLAMIGVWLLQVSHAATSSSAVEPETGVLSGGVTAGNDTSASGNSFVKFAQPSIRGMIVHGDSIAKIGYDTANPVQWDQLRLNLGLSVGYRNVGDAGTTTSEAAVRMGALDVVISSGSNAIASSPVTVSPVSTGTWRDVAEKWDGTLTNGNGQKLDGSLTHDTGSGGVPVWMFTRATGGTSYALTGAVTFHCTENDSYRNWVAMLEGGTNNIGGPVPDPDLSIAERDMDLMAKYAQGGYFITGLHVRPIDNPPRVTAKTNYINTMKARYPNAYVDVNAYTIANGLAQAGITPTPTDLQNLSQGMMPTSLMNPDGTHPSPTGLLIWRRAMEQFIRSNIPAIANGRQPVTAPVAPNPAHRSSTSRSIAIDWAAVPGAIGYKVEYRRTGTTAWQLSVHTNGTSATVTDIVSGSLSPATSYEIKVTAVNEAGGGTPGSLTASTQ